MAHRDLQRDLYHIPIEEGSADETSSQKIERLLLELARENGLTDHDMVVAGETADSLTLIYDKFAKRG